MNELTNQISFSIAVGYFFPAYKKKLYTRIIEAKLRTRVLELSFTVLRFTINGP